MEMMEKMKPIKLKIKGLNSFIEPQQIDFEQLTDRGLFGIFGPTGSGKSTILDGITLSLYGEVARKSSNYMNTNCKTLNVSFEFQISGKEIKRYRAEREFKRDNKTGSVRSKSAKITDITNDAEDILEEGSRNVTEKCEEIIGLKLEDFTRTVVLPQGKFSEFLKLEGKDRRTMLERLFNLRKYGDELSFKLAGEIKREREKSNLLQGELKGYENISEEILDEKKKALEEINENYDKCKKKLSDLEIEFNKCRELWNLQNDLKEQLLKQEELKKNEDSIIKIQKKVSLGESSLKLKPYIEGYENTLLKIKVVEKELSSLNDNIEIINKNKDKLDNLLNDAKSKKDRELPELKIKEQKVLEAIEEELVLNKLIDDKKVIEKSTAALEKSLQNNNEDFKNIEISIDEINSKINVKDKKVEALKISEEYKKKVNRGMLLSNSFESLMKQKNDADKNMEAVKSSIENSEEKSEVLSKKINERSGIIDVKKDSLSKLIDECPGDENSLLDLQQKLTVLKDKWKKYKDYSSALNKDRTEIENFNSELKDRKNEKLILNQKIEDLNKEISKLQKEHLAQVLRNSLVDGEPCPVCGAIHHNIENIEITGQVDSEKLKLIIDDETQKYKKLNDEIIRIEISVKNSKRDEAENVQKLNELGDDFKTNSLKSIEDEFANLKLDINKFNSTKSDLENKIKALTQDKNDLEIEYSKATTSKVEGSRQLKKLKQDFEKIKFEFEKTNNELFILKEELDIEDFIKKNEEIIEKEREKAAIESSLKKLRCQLELKQKNKENLNSMASELRENLSKNKAVLIEKNKNIEEKKQSIKSKACNRENLEDFKKEISGYIEKIEKEYETAENESKEIQDRYNKCNRDIIAAQSNLVSLKERYIEDKEKLIKALSEENIKDIDEARKSYMDKNHIYELKLKVEDYKNTVFKITGAIENLSNKIGNRYLSEERWLKMQSTTEDNKESLEKFKKDKIELEKEVLDMSKKMLELKEILKQKEKSDHKLSLLDDLEKLFKGKKFVEFVALNQLKYISIEADKKLKEITCGNYGLEVDEDGKFIIRDYKNGGAERDASTLSGGETFITSLALALALSAQIQLKGTAPLELFFLDEGFGTLDDNLLEIVMDSLEKIQNKRLSIGIISHLESIKNRVPVKLIVTPAEAGVGGSHVNIERS